MTVPAPPARKQWYRLLRCPKTAFCETTILYNAHAKLQQEAFSSESELLNGVLPRCKLRSKNAQDADHGKAAIADLLGPHLLGVHLDSEWVAKVTGRLAILLPPSQLQDRNPEEEHREAKDAFPGPNGGKTCRSLLETRQLHEMLAQQADRRHHGNAAVLQLRSAELVEALLVAHRREAQRVE